ncbi:hypothetical protein CPter91_5288 [Collimonas pratensis]|uniref:Uncharacterized protein n=1 Tax=Collimonas pratensis TaxID=279113 RepID=A0A127QC25_9BURK|nr:hypothetical protein CPter91_5288 [Collimonas pratensis]
MDLFTADPLNGAPASPERVNSSHISKQTTQTKIAFDASLK